MNTNLMKKKNFHFFHKLLLNKKLLSIVIQNKNYLFVLHKHKVNIVNLKFQSGSNISKNRRN